MSMRYLERLTNLVSKIFEWIGAIGLILMFITNLVDVLGAKVFLKPLTGSTELIGFWQILAVAGAISYTLITNRHIRVDFFTVRFGAKIRGIIHAFSGILGLGLFLILSWESFLYGTSLKASGEIGSTSHIPLYPFAYFIAVASIVVCLSFLLEIINSLREVLQNGSR